MTTARTFLIALLCCVPFSGSVAQGTTDGSFVLLVDDEARACTTLIAERQFEDARVACDADVDRAKVPITTGLNPHGHSNREALAIAYSNRAVLNWLTGNVDAANDDIAHALRQNRYVADIRRNQVLVADRYMAGTD